MIKSPFFVQLKLDLIVQPTNPRRILKLKRDSFLPKSAEISVDPVDCRVDFHEPRIGKHIFLSLPRPGNEPKRQKISLKHHLKPPKILLSLRFSFKE
jgi:hypothetical protein